jgi:hypothetical protein
VGEEEDVSEFMTPDLQLAAYLVALGHPVERVERERHPKVFVFGDVAEQDISSYYRGTRPVPPQPLFQAYRRLNHLLFARPA